MTNLGLYLAVWTVVSFPAGLAMGAWIAWSKRQHG